jgi:hypothetical protein
MQKRMCWLSKSGQFGDEGEKILHLQTAPHEGWRPYTAFPQFAAPDHNMPGGSKGLATFQKLLKAGWIVVPSNLGKG